MTADACELRLGRWQDALADIGEVDALITDPPYSARTHDGHDEGTRSANDRARMIGRLKKDGSRTTPGRAMRRSIAYTPWTPDDVRAFVAAWAPRVRGWIVALTDHVLAPVWEASYAETGRYVFAPLQYMEPGSRVRMTGDGPSLWSVTIVVARPKTRDFQHWGALPGGYVLPPRANNEHNLVTGGKPLWLMRALVRDYSRPGDLVCDPCAGGATTLLAARLEGRRAIGAELDPTTHALATKRLARPYTPQLFSAELRERAANDNGTQADLFGADGALLAPESQKG
jgi:site-specific DNA-methyltransferase (adenine-specific)